MENVRTIIQQESNPNAELTCDGIHFRFFLEWGKNKIPTGLPCVQ